MLCSFQTPGSDEEQTDSIRRSGRARKTVDYTFRDFDEEILDAVEKDKKPSLGEGEMNGHPTGKPAFAVERFYSASSSKSSRRRSRRLKDLDSGSDSESKISDYEYEGSTDEDRPKRPERERERHIYLRRHLLDDEDEDDASETQTNGVGESDNDSSDTEDKPKTKKAKIEDDDEEEEEHVASSKQEDGNKINDSQDSNKDNTDASSEKSGPTAAPASPKDKHEHSNVDGDKENRTEEEKDDGSAPVKTKETDDNDVDSADKTETTKKGDDHKSEEKKNKDSDEDKNDKSEKTKSNVKDIEVKKNERKDTLDLPKSRPPPLERISPKIDPLLDSLGFGALASFSNSERYPPSRTDQYGTLRSPSQTIRSPLSSDTGFSTGDRLGVPLSPSSYPRVSSESRYGAYPPSYDQSTSYANYLGYNQTTSSMDPYPGSPSSRQSYPGLSFPGTRQYPGFSPTSLSKRDTSPSYNPPPPPYGSAGYPYPGNDMTSRSSYYPSTNQGYSFPTKNPYPAPQAGYYPDSPFGTGMFYGNTGSSMQQGGVNSWPSTSSNSSSYYPPTGLG